MSNVDRFVSGETPMRAARMRAALTRVMLKNGKCVSRQDIVEDMVKQGASVLAHVVDGRRLTLPDGAYIEEARLTKTAMDYAEHCICLHLFGLSL